MLSCISSFSISPINSIAAFQRLKRTMLLSGSRFCLRTGNKAQNLFSLTKKNQLHDITFSAKTNKVSVRYGTGFRSSSNGQIATVFGCTGSLGRYVVNKLARQGIQVVVPYRGEEDNKRHLKLAGDLGQIVPMEFDLRNYDQVLECVRHSDIVVNLIGRPWETRNFSFRDVHATGAGTIARACRESGVGRLIHVSALNAEVNSPCEFYASKGLGEEAVMSEFDNVTIVRPSVVYGPEDYFLNRIGFTKHGHLTLNKGAQELYPVNVIDIALAIELIALEPLAYNRKIFELVGPQKLSYASIIEMASQILKEDIRTIDVSFPVFTAIAKALRVYPYRILRHEEISMMLINDKVHKDTLKFEDLGIEPQSLEHCILSVMRAYRSPMFYDLGYDTERLSQISRHSRINLFDYFKFSK